MKDLWERLKRRITGQDTIDQWRREHELRMEWHREAIEQAVKQARAELRDRFAMAALTGLLAKGTVSHLHYEECQYHADSIADAMMKARGDE